MRLADAKYDLLHALEFRAAASQKPIIIVGFQPFPQERGWHRKMRGGAIDGLDLYPFEPAHEDIFTKLGAKPAARARPFLLQAFRIVLFIVLVHPDAPRSYLPCPAGPASAGDTRMAPVLQAPVCPQFPRTKIASAVHSVNAPPNAEPMEARRLSSPRRDPGVLHCRTGLQTRRRHCDTHGTPPPPSPPRNGGSGSPNGR